MIGTLREEIKNVASEKFEFEFLVESSFLAFSGIKGQSEFRTTGQKWWFFNRSVFMHFEFTVETLKDGIKTLGTEKKCFWNSGRIKIISTFFATFGVSGFWCTEQKKNFQSNSLLKVYSFQLRLTEKEPDLWLRSNMSSNVEIRQHQNHFLEFSVYEDSDATVKVVDFSIGFTFSSVKQSIRRSIEKLNPVIT